MQLGNGPHKKPLTKIGIDAISAAYKATALKAAEDMPAERSLGEQAGYVYEQLSGAHPEIEWGVLLTE